MSDFWWGVLALPLIVVGLAVAAAIVFGGWSLAEGWAERRYGDMDYDPGDTAHLRVRYATWIMAAPVCRRFRLGYGCTLLYTRGDLREDDAEAVIAALGMVKGVLSVQAIEHDVHQIIAESRRDVEWHEGLTNLIQEMRR